jgi:hypothetical protein
VAPGRERPSRPTPCPADAWLGSSLPQDLGKILKLVERSGVPAARLNINLGDAATRSGPRAVAARRGRC